eukprot:gene4377-biopygen154
MAAGNAGNTGDKYKPGVASEASPERAGRAQQQRQGSNQQAAAASSISPTPSQSSTVASPPQDFRTPPVAAGNASTAHDNIPGVAPEAPPERAGHAQQQRQGSSQQAAAAPPMPPTPPRNSTVTSPPQGFRTPPMATGNANNTCDKDNIPGVAPPGDSGEWRGRSADVAWACLPLRVPLG